MFSVLPTASLTVLDLFSTPFHYTVPCYQRPYSWTNKEAGQLLEDILAAAGLGGDGAPAESDYFIGTIILLDPAGGDLPKVKEKEPRLFEIIDGQQRLITLAILAAVLRDLGTDKWRWGGRRLDQLLSADATAVKSKTAHFRIELRNHERRFFQDYVQAPSSCGAMPAQEAENEAEARLFAVREHFISELAAFSDANRRRLADFLCVKCHFVVVLSRDIDRAHHFFTVLNGRGRSLQRNDILKAELLKGVPPERANSALAQWESAATKLGPAFEAFFSHLFNIYGHSESKIITGIRRLVRETGGTEPFLKSILTPLAHSYHLLRNAGDLELPIDAEARRYLVYLGRLPEGDWAPAGILALQQYQEDPARATLLLKEIDRLAHLLRLLCNGKGKRMRRFAAVINQIKSHQPIVPGEGAFQLTRDEVRSIGYHLRTLYRRDQQVCKLLLLRLNDEIARNTTVLDPGDCSVEHVLPQRPGANSEWRRWYAEAEEREACTESLGNLVVVTQRQNDRARNQDFSRKREIYRGTPDDSPMLAITREVADANIWRSQEVRAREAQLLSIICEIWGIDVVGMRPQARGAA